MFDNCTEKKSAQNDIIYLVFTKKSNNTLLNLLFIMYLIYVNYAYSTWSCSRLNNDNIIFGPYFLLVEVDHFRK